MGQVADEPSWAASCHDADVIVYEPVWRLVLKEDMDCVRDDAVGACMVVAKVAHQEWRIQVVVEKAGHHGGLLGRRDRGLALPLAVVSAEPTEVIEPIMYYSRH